MTTQLAGGPLNIFLFLSIALFGLGVFGVLVRRNALLVLMSIELMLNAVNVAFVTFARGFAHQASAGSAHVFVLMIMAVAAAEAAIGIAIVVTIYRDKGKVLVDEARELKG
jgi:NADH-quinone oxidoreductase subunit K